MLSTDSVLNAGNVMVQKADLVFLLVFMASLKIYHKFVAQDNILYATVLKARSLKWVSLC